MWKKIRNWFWWNFQATEMEKSQWDLMTIGTSIMKNRRRINPRKFYNL